MMFNLFILPLIQPILLGQINQLSFFALGLIVILVLLYSLSLLRLIDQLLIKQIIKICHNRAHLRNPYLTLAYLQAAGILLLLQIGLTLVLTQGFLTI